MTRRYAGRQIVLLMLVSMAMVACRPGAPAAPTHQPDAPVSPPNSATAVDDPRVGTGAASTARLPALKVEVVWTVEGEPDQARLPLAVAISTQGQLYLADGGSQRIEVFDPDGRFIAAWGGEGSEVGQFRFRPTHRCDDAGAVCAPELGGGVAVDGQGRVYVADYGNHRVQVFDHRGSFLASWGRAGQGEGQFWLPAGIAVDGQGQVYVSDTGNRRIQKFDRSGRFLTEWGRFGVDARLFIAPGALAVDGHGRVSVVDPWHNQVQQFDGQGRFLRQWAIGSPGGMVPVVSAMAVDRHSQIYSTDATNRIQKLSDTGQVLATWGSGGPWDVVLQRPSGIAVDEDGAIYITDRDAGRLLKVRQLLPITS